MADAVPVNSDKAAKQPKQSDVKAVKKADEVVPANPYKVKGGAAMPGPVKLVREDF